MKTVIRYFVLLYILTACNAGNQPKFFIPVTEATDRVIERIIRQTPTERLDSLDDAFVMNFITKEEKRIFADNHWVFTVDRPAMVSVMRHKQQAIAPFWLVEKGFVNTGKTVKNQEYEYEVWQKQYPAGIIHLGINGFDLHRVVYFVTIGPATKGDTLHITDFYPAEWPVITMQEGAYMYNDWDELTVQEMPDELRGHTLFTTIRGRAREACIVKCFRTTEYPSSVTPDQTVLTWDNDPSTTQAIQWRTDTTVTDGYVRYRKSGAAEKDVQEVSATFVRLKDVYISNDIEVNHWGVTITDLSPGTRYEYTIGSQQHNTHSKTYSFKTAPAKDARFTFIFLGDTHNADIVKPVMEQAMRDCPDAAFLTHSGDHVNTGLFRDLWEKYIALGQDVFANLAFMPALGNHDSQDGLPPILYTRLFRLPTNNNCNLTAGRNYSFKYANARFFSIDATGNVDDIACWLNSELMHTTETWKIAVMHFPPYTTDNSYADLREKWCSLFDKYHVDLVLSGHIHQYFRSYPLAYNEVADNPAKGVVYVSSVVVETREKGVPSSKYNPVFANKGGLYQLITINGNQLDFLSKCIDGQIIDKFQITKP